jgi:hypothetical protein
MKNAFLKAALLSVALAGLAGMARAADQDARVSPGKRKENPCA